MTKQFQHFSVSELFLPLRGKAKYTRSYGDQFKGEYPVYSASLSSPLCQINTFDYDGTYLTWAANGYGGRMQILSGKFSINGDRGILIPLDGVQLDLEYIKRVLEPLLRDQAVGRKVDGKKNEYTKVSPEVVAESLITLPVNENGSIDQTVMKDVAAKITQIDVFQRNLLSFQEEICDVELVVECAEPYTLISLGEADFFSLSIGNRVLKKDSLKSGIPVFSANVNKPFAFLKDSNLVSFDSDSILWGIDGNFDWNLIPKDSPFATTDHCGRLLVKSEKLDPEYLFYALRGSRLEYGFDRVFRASLENVASYVSVKVPLNVEGEFSMPRQKEIARKYRELHELKRKTNLLIESLSSKRVDISI